MAPGSIPSLAFTVAGSREEAVAVAKEISLLVCRLDIFDLRLKWISEKNGKTSAPVTG